MGGRLFWAVAAAALLLQPGAAVSFVDTSLVVVRRAALASSFQTAVLEEVAGPALWTGAYQVLQTLSLSGTLFDPTAVNAGHGKATLTGDGTSLLLMTHSVAGGTAMATSNGVPQVSFVGADGTTSTVVGVAPPSWTKGLTDTIYAFNTSSRAPVYYSWWTQYSLGASNRPNYPFAASGSNGPVGFGTYAASASVALHTGTTYAEVGSTNFYEYECSTFYNGTRYYSMYFKGQNVIFRDSFITPGSTPTFTGPSLARAWASDTTGWFFGFSTSGTRLVAFVVVDSSTFWGLMAPRGTFSSASYFRARLTGAVVTDTNQPMDLSDNVSRTFTRTASSSYQPLDMVGRYECGTLMLYMLWEDRIVVVNTVSFAEYATVTVPNNAAKPPVSLALVPRSVALANTFMPEDAGTSSRFCVNPTVSTSSTPSKTRTPSTTASVSASPVSPSVTPSRSPSGTVSLSRTPSPVSPSITPSPSITKSVSPSPVSPSITRSTSITPSSTRSSSPSVTVVIPSVTPSASRTVSSTAVATRSASQSASLSPSLSASVTSSETPSSSATPSTTPSPTESASASRSLSMSVSASLTPSKSTTPSPSVSVSVAATRTPSPSVSMSFGSSPSSSNSVLPSSSVTPSISPSSSASPSITPTETPSTSVSASSSASVTASHSGTVTRTVTKSTSPSPSGSKSVSISASRSASSSWSSTGSATPSVSGTMSPSASMTATTSPTNSVSSSASASATASASPSPSTTGSASPSSSETPSSSSSPSSSAWPARSPSTTATPSVTGTRSASASTSYTPTMSETPSSSSAPAGSPSRTPSASRSALPCVLNSTSTLSALSLTSLWQISGPSSVEAFVSGGGHCALQESLRAALELPSACRVVVLAALNATHAAVAANSTTALLQTAVAAAAAADDRHICVDSWSVFGSPAVAVSPASSTLCGALATNAAGTGRSRSQGAWLASLAGIQASAPAPNGPAVSCAVLIACATVRIQTFVDPRCPQPSSTPGDDDTAAAFLAAAQSTRLLQVGSGGLQQLVQLQSVTSDMATFGATGTGVSSSCQSVVVTERATNTSTNTTGGSPAGGFIPGAFGLVIWPDVVEAEPSLMPTASSAPPSTGKAIEVFFVENQQYFIYAVAGAGTVILGLVCALGMVCHGRRVQAAALARTRRLRTDAKTQKVMAAVVEEVRKDVVAATAASVMSAASSSSAAAGASQQPLRVKRTVMTDNGALQSVELPAVVSKVVIESVVLGALDYGLQHGGADAAARAQLAARERVGFEPRVAGGQAPGGSRKSGMQRASSTFSVVSPIAAKAKDAGGALAPVSPPPPPPSLEELVSFVSRNVATSVLTECLVEVADVSASEISAEEVTVGELSDTSATLGVNPMVAARSQPVAAHAVRTKSSSDRVAKVQVGGKLQRAQWVNVNAAHHSASVSKASREAQVKQRVTAIVNAAAQAGFTADARGASRGNAPAPVFNRKLVEGMVAHSMAVGNTTADTAARLVAHPGRRPPPPVCSCGASRNAFDVATERLLQAAMEEAKHPPRKQPLGGGGLPRPKIASVLNIDDGGETANPLQQLSARRVAMQAGAGGEEDPFDTKASRNALGKRARQSMAVVRTQYATTQASGRGF